MPVSGPPFKKPLKNLVKSPCVHPRPKDYLHGLAICFNCLVMRISLYMISCPLWGRALWLNNPAE